MLSKQEYNKIIDQLNEPSLKISTDTKKKLRKKLKEHEYSIKFAPFEPLPHISYFINRTTSKQIVHQLIQAANTAMEFIMDTESWNIFQQSNKPALIQLQILLPHDSSLVSLIEVHHLPKQDNIVFKLIQQLFEIIFTSEKKIFIFGSKDELYPFIQFELFSHDQIHNMKMINLQEKFKVYWNEHHPHQSTNSTSLTTSNNCMCEKCIGKNPSETWSLQDCVAFLLNEHLPKTLSNENFQIGLDPELFKIGHNEQQHRDRLSTYAKNDCLSMQRLIIQMKKHKFNFNSTSTIPMKTPQKRNKFILPKFYDEAKMISSDDEYPSEEQIANQILSTKQSSTPVNDIPETNPEAKHKPNHEPTSTSNPTTNNKEEQPSSNYHKSGLSDEERKRIHNRTCTTKQRRRYYANEILIKNIDDRFSIRAIKDILKYKNVSFFAVNKFVAKKTNELTLAIGIRDTTKLSSYRMELRNLFTSSHFLQFQRMKRQLKYRYRKNN